jgi:hypothetical protein
MSKRYDRQRAWKKDNEERGEERKGRADIHSAIKSNKGERTYENWKEGRKGSTIWDKKNCISSEE